MDDNREEKREDVNDQTMKKALEATARVACCSFLIGAISCHAKNSSPEQAETTPKATAPAAVQTPPVVADTEPASVLSSPAFEYPDHLKDCVQQIKKELQQEKREIPSEEAIDCCYQTAEYVLKAQGHVKGTGACFQLGI